MWNAIGPIAGAVLGGLFQRGANKENEENQREFAQMGIRWRVEDAKAAGLHPLYALGGGGATYSPSAQPLMQSQDISRAVSAFGSAGEREFRAAQLEAVKAGAVKDYALAAAADAEAARHRQATLATASSDSVAQAFPVRMPSWQGNEAGGFTDQSVRSLGPPTPSPPSYLSSATSEPGFKLYSTPVGQVILPAGSSMSEAVESMENPIIQAAVLAANLVHFGPSGRARIRKFLGENFKWYSDPAGAVGDAVRNFGQRRSKLPQE